MNRKQLFKLIKKAIEDSVFNNKVDPVKVAKYIKLFKALPQDDAIFGLENYAKGLKRVESSHTLYIYSPIKLENAQVDGFIKHFKDKHIIMDFEVIIDSSLIGGIRFKIGDTVYDDSVQSKIEQVKGVIVGV